MTEDAEPTAGHGDTGAGPGFWEERRICFLATQRPDGTPHLVPVGATWDAATGTARVIARRSTRKVRNVLAAGPDARVAISQVDGRRWSTLEGPARINDDQEAVADAVARYARRYQRTPQPQPDRVVIEVTVVRVLGNEPPPGAPS